MNERETDPGRQVAYWACWCVVGLMFVAAAIVLPLSPERVAIHWSMSGQPDGTASAVVGLLLVPIITLGLHLFLMVLPRLDPGGENYVNFREVYWKVGLAIELYFAASHTIVCACALGMAVNMSIAMPLLIGGLLILIGNYLSKIRPNWMIGIRTPWTLSSKRSWNQTHRLGRWLMIIMGAAIACLSLSQHRNAWIAVGTICLLSLVAMVVYSWWVWRSDPDKVATAGVRPNTSDDAVSDPHNSGFSLLLLIGTLFTVGSWSSTGRCDSSPPITKAIELETPTGTLHAALDLPEESIGPVPVALILPGSGPTDADGNSPGARNDSLKQLGDELAKQGIACCRVHKRGIGPSREAGVKESGLRFETYVDDAILWITHLHADTRFSRVHLIGHSEGALIGILAAQTSKVASYVSISGTGLRASDLLREQLKPKLPPAFMQQAESILRQLEAGRLVESVPSELAVLFRPSVQPYLISWFNYDPALEIAKLDSVPTLIVQGSTDVQCSVDDAKRLSNGLKSAEKVIIPDMNHVLKHATTATLTAQLKTYTDPTLPLHEQLMPALTAFLKKH